MIVLKKEFEIQGCVEVPQSVPQDEFLDKLIKFIEENNWLVGGGVSEIIDGFYINEDQIKGK